MKVGILEITPEDIKALCRFLREMAIRLFTPRNKGNKIGILIAIRTENEVEKKRLQHDLVQDLRQYLHESHIPAIFNVMQLPEYHANKIKDHHGSERYLRRTRCHFIVYGSIAKRKVKGELNYVFKLEGAVIHRPIPQTMSNTLSQEFTALLPRRWRFPDSEELLGFDITKDWLGIVAKYIVGIASHISGHFELAYKIFDQLRNETTSETFRKVPVVNEIKRRLPLRFVEVSDAICHRFYFYFTQTREHVYFEKLKPYLDVLQKYSPDDYSAHILRAIYFFLTERNTGRAIEELKKIRDRPDTTWRYNLAFLYAYQGQLEKAKKQYDHALRGYVPTNIINETEVFISEIISAEPQKYQLYFARGYINFKAKNDYSLAKEDFAKFIKQCPDDMHQNVVRLVKIYIDQIAVSDHTELRK